MFSVWQSVQVSNKEHARTGEAGTVFAVDPKKPEHVAVKFDTSGIIEDVAVADLRAL